MPELQTVYEAFAGAVRAWPHNPCITTGSATLTFAELDAQVRRLAAALQGQFAVKRGDGVIVVADQSERWLVIALALQAIGAIEFPRGLHTTPAALNDLAHQTQCRTIFFQNAAALEAYRARARTGKPALICIEGGAKNGFSLNDILRSGGGVAFLAAAHKVSAVICTSGTTGDAKAVPVLQASFLHAMRVAPKILNLTQSDVFLSCLPSWHLYARLVEYIALCCGGKIVYSGIPDLQDKLLHSGCTIFPSFPEIWEKICHEILHTLSRSRLAALFTALIRINIRADRLQEQQISSARYSAVRPGFLARLQLFVLIPWRFFIHHSVFRAIRSRVSPRLRYAIMGDAPLPRSVDETLRALGFQVLEGYGSTEQCITALRRPGRNFPGMVGKILPGVHAEIRDILPTDWHGLRVGEICVEGENVFCGYFSGMKALREIAPATVSYATGDLGSVDQYQNLVVVGRKQNAFQLKNGAWVFPELMENILRGSHVIAAITVFGAGAERPAAIVVPDFGAVLTKFARSGSKHPNYAQNPEHHKKFWQALLTEHRVVTHFRGEIHGALAGAGLPEHLWINRFLLVPHRFHRGNELTMTLKPRRHIIAQRYAAFLRQKVVDPTPGEQDASSAPPSSQ